MQTPLVFNIQRYSVHDGDGIRTTIFFKGCPLSCRWCHNPESQRYQQELMVYTTRCVGCGACVPRCPQGAIQMVDGVCITDRTLCTACGACTDYCLKNARELVGKTYTVDELVREALKDMAFFEESGGGVTLSGGEAMCQDLEYLTALCKKLHGRGIHICIDTCGYVNYSAFEAILPYVDCFLYDIKAMDSQLHRHYIGCDNQLILENLIKLSQAKADINLRIPLILGVNAQDEFIDDLIAFLHQNKIHPFRMNLLPYHNISMGKYQNLDRQYQSTQMDVPSEELMQRFRDKLINSGFTNSKIGG